MEIDRRRDDVEGRRATKESSQAISSLAVPETNPNVVRTGRQQPVAVGNGWLRGRAAGCLSFIV